MGNYYAGQRTDIVSNGAPVDLDFEVKQILVMSDTVLNANCMTCVLFNEKVVGVRDSYDPDFGIKVPPSLGWYLH